MSNNTLKYIFTILLSVFISLPPFTFQILPSFSSDVKNKKVSYKEIRKRKHSKNKPNLKNQVINCTGLDIGCPSGQICSQQMTCCLPCPYKPDICDDGGISAAYRAPILNFDATNIDNMSTAASSSTSTTAWTDLSGNGNNGTLNNFTLPTGGSASGWDGANSLNNPSTLKFDGSDDYVTSSTNALGGGINITVEAWIKKNNTADTTDVVVSGESVSSLATFFLGQWIIGTSNPTFGIWDGSSWKSISSNVNITDTNWHHLVGTNNGTQIQIWLDGALKGTSTGATTTLTATSINVGRAGWSGNRAYFNGSIANTRIYPTVLTPFQIYQNYLAESSRFGLTATAPPSFTCNASLVPPPPFTAANTAQPQATPVQTPSSLPIVPQSPAPSSTLTPIQNITNTNSGSSTSPPLVSPSVPIEVKPPTSNTTPQPQPTPLTQEQIDIVKSGMVIDIGLINKINKGINIPAPKPPAVKTDSAPYIDFSTGNVEK